MKEFIILRTKRIKYKKNKLYPILRRLFDQRILHRRSKNAFQSTVISKSNLMDHQIWHGGCRDGAHQTFLKKVGFVVTTSSQVMLEPYFKK